MIFEHLLMGNCSIYTFVHFNRVILATQNKEKLHVIMRILKLHCVTYNSIICENVNSEVDESPENEETVIGATNRVNNLIKMYEPQQNDMFVGLESGLFRLYNDKWYEKCICYVAHYKDIVTPTLIYAGSEEYPLSDFLNDILNSGKSHRDGMKILRDTKNISQETKDTFAIYTNGEKHRTVTFEQSFENCLYKLKYP